MRLRLPANTIQCDSLLTSKQQKSYIRVWLNFNLTRRQMKTLIKHSEPSIIDEFRNEMDRFFDDIVPFSIRKRNGDSAMDTWSPMTDLSETETEYKIVLDLPGIEKKDIKISMQEHRLIISGERKKEEKEEKRDFMRRERYFGSFYRAFTLPESIKEDAVKAQFKDGVLVVTVPKSEVKKPKSIKIE